MDSTRASFLDWTFYQIYPRSFYDSNGDGIGDLRGITEKIDHLVDLGVNAVWLSPCYKSPNGDNGYDISDYRDIQADFGTLGDWKEMIAALHDRGIRLIMDLVANHTSSEHRWFQQARQSRDNPYRDYYYWFDEPPTDWQACFGGSAWEYDETTGQYYLHSFDVTQPDLNWTNPAVRREIREIVDYWVALGVDGFRCDVLDMIAKDFRLGANGSQPQLHTYIRELFDRPHLTNLFTVGECWGASPKNIADLIAPDRHELSAVFQFEHVMLGQTGRFAPTAFCLNDLKAVFCKWQQLIGEDKLYTLFLENHDQPRCVSRFGMDTTERYESATLLATMTFLLRGVPFIYQGQEIGVTNSWHDRIEDFDDVETVNYYRDYANDPAACSMELINYGSRDNARRPMPWNAGENGGFSTHTPWLPVYARYREINVASDRAAEKSVFAFYRQLLALRKESMAVRHGTFADVTGDNADSFAYLRAYEGEKLLVVCNFERGHCLRLPFEGACVLSNAGGRTAVSGDYAPYEAAVFRL